MLLRDWLKKESVTPHSLAKEIGMCPSAMYRALTGERKISRQYAKKIEAATKGRVSRNEAMWPADFVEKKENGSQMCWVPKSEE